MPSRSFYWTDLLWYLALVLCAMATGALSGAGVF